jgi:hypothetical protein
VAAFERALLEFRRLYHVLPQVALCSPDVLTRYCALFEHSADVALLHTRAIAHDTVLLSAAVLPPGTIAFEGEVDESRMGDW